MASKRMAVVLIILFLSMVTATNAGNRRICGEQLADTLSLVCNGSFNKRSAGIFRLKRSIATMYIKNKRVVEEDGGVVEECCYREEGCSILTLMSYCSASAMDYSYEDLTSSESAEQPVVPEEETFPTTTTVSPTVVMTTHAQLTRSPDQIFRSYVNRWRTRTNFRRPRPSVTRTNSGKWFFLPMQLGPSPTRRPFSPL